MCFQEQGEKCGWRYSTDDDLSSLAVDVERQIATFRAKTLRVRSGLVVLTYCTLGQRLLLLSLES